MVETDQLHQDFLKDFTELLEKYNASFEIYTDGPHIVFTSQYDYMSDKLVRGYSTIQLPDFINSN